MRGWQNHTIGWLAARQIGVSLCGMKANLVPLAFIAAVIPFSTLATTYTDATGDSVGGSLDITSIVVNNDATTLSLKISVAADPLSIDWGKYLIGFDTVAGGNTTGPDAWGKPISMSVGGMDFFAGSWMNFGTGAEMKTWSGSAWDAVSGSGIAVATDASSVTLSMNLAALSLAPGSTFNFDVYTTSDGNSALDAAGSNTALTWGNTAYDSGANVLTYTVAAVPEPGASSLLGLGGLLLAWRAKKRSV
jgi:hypothetical protein